MARMLDLLQPNESRRPRVEPNPVVTPVVEEPSDEDIPFVEVGAPFPAQARKASRVVTPTIIPMPTRTVEPLGESSPAYYRISFQPLPFPARPDSPAAQSISRELVAFYQPSHEISEQYRHLLSEIEAQLGPESGKALLFGSPLPGAGTTTVLLNLAITRARDLRVAVVDANLRRPAVADRLGCAASPGLREVLARTVPLTWALQATAQPNLHVLPAGTRSSELSMDLWPVLLDQLRQRFDWVLIDGGECTGRAEWKALAGTAMATYLVLHQAELERPELHDLLTDVSRQGSNLRGYVLTSN